MQRLNTCRISGEKEIEREFQQGGGGEINGRKVDNGQKHKKKVWKMRNAANVRKYGKEREGVVDRQIVRQTDRQTDRQIDR